MHPKINYLRKSPRQTIGNSGTQSQVRRGNPRSTGCTANCGKPQDAKPEAVGPLGLYARSVTGLPLRPNNAKKGN